MVDPGNRNALFFQGAKKFLKAEGGASACPEFTDAKACGIKPHFHNHDPPKKFTLLRN
jgi:hypothetical protein